MTLTELFAKLSTRGLSVCRSGDELECTGDTSALTDELKAALVQHRHEFLRMLPDRRDVIDRLKEQAVSHFMPYHPLPEPGETTVFFPGHHLLDFEWDEPVPAPPSWCFRYAHPKAWRSVYGEHWICATCHPPVSEDVVVEWSDEKTIADS